MSSPSEDEEQVRMLLDVCTAMIQIVDPDNAIALIKELSAASPPALTEPAPQPMLPIVLDKKHLRNGNAQPTRPIDGTLLATITGGVDPAPVTGTAHCSRESSYDMDIDQTINAWVMFETTGDIDYLNVGITLAEGIIAVIPSAHPRRREVLTILGDFHHQRFDLLDRREDLESGIQAMRQAIEISSPSDFPGFEILDNLSILFNHKYDRYGVLEECESLISVGKEGGLGISLDDRGRPSRLFWLSYNLYGRFRQSGDQVDLDRSILLAQEAAETGSADNQVRLEANWTLGCSLFTRFRRSGAMEDLERAIQVTEEAIATTPPAYLTSALVANLGVMLWSRFSRLGDLADLQKSIQAIEKPIVPFPRGSNLGLIRWNASDVHTDRDSNVAMEDAIDNPIQANHRSTTASHNLSVWLWHKFSRLGDLKDLDKSIHAIEKAVAATPQNSDRLPRSLRMFGSLLHTRFQSSGNRADIDKAIDVTDCGIMRASIDHPDRLDLCYNLGLYLDTRFGRWGSLGDLKRSIGAMELALLLTPPGHRRRATILQILAIQSNRMSDISEAPENLVKAIGASAEAIAATPPGNPEFNDLLQSHSILLFLRFIQFGSGEDIDNAIEMIERALAAVPGGRSPSGPMLMNLGNMLLARFRQFGALDDLERGNNLYEQAVEATSPGHPGRPHVLGMLAVGYYNRYLRLGAVSDIEKAIEAGEQSVAAFPCDHPDRAKILHNRILMRLSSPRITAENGGSIEKPTPSPPGHHWQANRLMCLSYQFLNKYHQSQAVADLENAIQAGEQAVHVIPTDHPSRAVILRHVGRLQLTYITKKLGILQSILSGNEPECQLNSPVRWSTRNKMHVFLNHVHPDQAISDISGNSSPDRIELLIEMLNLESRLQEASNHFRTAWGCASSPPPHRIDAAELATRFLGHMGHWAEASSLLDAAVEMLPTVSPQFLSPDDQQYTLSKLSPLTAAAIAAALQAGSDPSHCLKLIELGRGILMGFAIDCRIDLPQLHQNSALFDKFHRLRIETDTPLAKVPGESGQGAERRRRRRVHAIRERDQTLASIRQQPGFEDFQLPPRPENLMAMAEEGAIIIINSTELRSDAIIVTNSDIKALGLPKLVFSEVEIRMKQLAALVRGSKVTYNSRNEAMEGFLLWLWESTVKPVFHKLRLRAVDDSELLRVWWIGVGCLSAAPFHAAGNHSPGSKNNTLSRAISSYIPTIKALSYARQKKLNPGPNCRLLLVTMPTTPDTPATPFIPGGTGTPDVPNTHGITAMYRSDEIPATSAQKWTPLKNAQTEVHDIFNVVNQRPTTRFESPTVTQVLGELPYHHVIHLACHGVSDPANPSNSHLLLHGDDPSKPGKLTVKAISNLKIKNAQIAYLSACCTADNPSTELADESIHIASGFQLAGFSHVLGTLWDSNDEACRKVSVEFYRTLFHSDQTGDEGHRVVSTAFHHSVKKLRSEMLGQPIKWASFVHTGA